MHLGVKRSRSVPDHLRSWARLPRNLARFLAALGSPMRREAAAFPCPLTGHIPQSGPSNPRERSGSSPGVQEGLLPPCRGPGAKRGSRSSPAQRPAHNPLGRAPRRPPRQGSLPSSPGATRPRGWRGGAWATRGLIGAPRRHASSVANPTHKTAPRLPVSNLWSQARARGTRTRPR